MSPAAITQWTNLIIQCATLCTLLYTLSKFIGRNSHSQADRISALEEWKERVTENLRRSENRFDDTEEATRHMMNALLALMDAQISGNNVDELKVQRNNLNDYLTRR